MIRPPDTSPKHDVMRILYVFPIAALLAVASPALAQTPVFVLDSVEVTAVSRTSTVAAATGRAVEVITADDLARMPVRTITEVLTWAFGVDVMARSTAQADIAIRGSTFEQVVVLVDGVRMNDPQTGHFHMNLAVPLARVERIEIVRGAASAVHGADAMGGVINVVTRENGNRASIRAEAGSFGTGAAALTFARELGAAHVTVGADFHRTDGHREGVDAEAIQARADVSVPVGSRTITASLAHGARDFGADGFYGDFPSYEETRVTTASVGLTRGDGAFSLVPRLDLRRHEDDFVLFREDPAIYRNLHTSWQAGGQVVAHWTPAARVDVALGGEAYVDRLESTNLGEPEERRVAGFAEASASRGRWSGSVGARADHHEAFGGFLTPPAAAAVRLAPGLRLRASAARAFRAPTWTDRYYEDPANVGTPDLRPERSWTVEVGGDAAVGSLEASADLFRREAADLIDWARPAGGDGRWRTRNIGRAVFHGVEGRLGIDAGPLHWVASAALIGFESGDADGYESRYALRPLTRTLSLRIEHATDSPVRASLRVGNARRAGASGSDDERWTLVDARVAYDWTEQGTVYLDGRNLGGHAYTDLTGHAAPGRALYMGLEWRAGGR